jgi:hypothetical protein
MDRRSFLVTAAVGAAAGVAGGALYWRGQEIDASATYPGRAEGHWLRNKQALPAPSAERRVDVAILGSGIAGLSAAWRLAKAGHHDFVIVDGPEWQGNAAGGQSGGVHFPTGAHYLPLPSPESTHVREMLADFNVILDEPYAERPYYDERFIVHGPAERLLYKGLWQEGILPGEGVAPGDLAEQKKFFIEMNRLRDLCGGDGRRLFVVPLVLSSQDPEWTALDRLSFKAWLDHAGYQSEALHWYCNYCCRDDYGAGYDKVSAWAGLHYFCSRGGQARNAERGAVLTWPEGLAFLASRLAERAGLCNDKCDGRRIPASVYEITSTRSGVAIKLFSFAANGMTTSILHARRAICAMPLHVAARIVPTLHEFGFDAQKHLPEHAPWLVSNFLMKHFPTEQPGVPLAWDNVVYREPGLGYVVSTHQNFRVGPPERLAFTAYHALSDRSPLEARQWLQNASIDELLALASADLKLAYGWKLAPSVERVDITVRAHAMAIPFPGFLNNPGIAALRETDGPLLFAHADLSGYSVFEEAAWWGCRAAEKVLA